jgi:hypothetical protein
VVEPHAQDEFTQAGHGRDEPVLPPAPANQWTPHDGGIEPAPPARNASARAFRRLGTWLRRSRS